MINGAAGELECCDVIEYLAKKYDIKGEMWSGQVSLDRVCGYERGDKRFKEKDKRRQASN